MKRVLHEPGKIAKRLLDPLNISGINDPPAPGPAGPSAADMRAAELNAKEEAARKATSEATARAGARQSLLTDASLNDTFGSTSTKKKSLFGA